MWRAVPSAVAMSWLLVAWWAAPAGANHAPAGGGDCTAHTVTCYPECRYEWTGNRGTAIDPPQDNGPCEYPHVDHVDNWPTTQYVSGSVAVDNWPATQYVSGSVAVDNWPDVQAVSGSVEASQPDGERYDVDARCEPDVPCVANGNADEVRVTNAGAQDDAVTALFLIVACTLGLVSGRCLLGGLAR